VKLSTKFSLTIIGVLALAFSTGGISLLATREISRLMGHVAADNVPSVRAAEELEIALLEQRGFASSFLLDAGNTAWLEELDRRKPAFDVWLQKAHLTAHTQEERRLLDELTRVYQQYDQTRDHLIDLYQQGRSDEATALLLGDMSRLYDRAYRLCENLIDANESYIGSSLARSQRQGRNVAVGVGAAAGLTALLGLVLLSVFFRGILFPLRRMADDARNFTPGASPAAPVGLPDDELRTLGFYMRSLMTDVTETHTHLQQSRVQLMTSEKLASLGKLAASVAHEIRNPLTSLKMRLYTVRNAERGGADFDEDLRVISEEVTRLEEIVRNFLEFSRAPDLKVTCQEVSTLLDKALELCRHWFVEKGVNVRRDESPGLPPVRADREQMKQVLLNLLRNAAEAVEEGGCVAVSAVQQTDRNGRRMVVVRIHDDGPGIPVEIRERIPEPFLSTKPDGTGLGLCIAARIMAQHDGRLEIESPDGPGATLAVWIPAAEESDG
jgi:signal transduction histidine kinase